MTKTKNHLLENMTFEEFRTWSEEEENPVVLIPLGSQEIQGPVVPMGDFMLARKIAEEVAERANAVTRANHAVWLCGIFLVGAGRHCPVG